MASTPTVTKQLRFQRSGDERRTGEVEPRIRIPRTENLHRPEKTAVVIPQWNHRDAQGHGPPVLGAIDGGEVLHLLDVTLEGKGQGTGILTIHTLGGQAAAAADCLILLIPQQAPRRRVDKTEDALVVENQHRIVNALQHIRPSRRKDRLESILTIHATRNTRWRELIRSSVSG